MMFSKNRVSSRWRIGLFLLCACLLLTSQIEQAWAADSDEYNFSWLDPDKKIYVLQNRKFRKAGSPQLFLMGGISGETYRQVYQLQPRASFWFNEDFGLEVFYSVRWNNPNNVYQGLIQATGSGTSPYIREINSQMGMLFNWAPWYAKINVFNTILYFDWYFSLGAGVMQSSVGPKTPTDSVVGSQWVNENNFAVYAGTGHLFHLDERWTIRIDAMGHFYSAKNSYIGADTTSTSVFSNITYNLGLGLKL